MDKGAVLFICKRNAVISQMAETLARHLAPPGVAVFSAGVTPDEALHPLTLETMQNCGLDASAQYPKNVGDIKALRFDLAITLCAFAREDCPAIAGSPVTVHWNLEDPSVFGDKPEAAREAFRETAAELETLITDLFSRGYFSAFSTYKHNTDRIIDNLSEGVMAHDLHRKIFFFSRGAERLTGLSATEVLGKDCYDVFVPRLCGENCSFCDGMEVSPFQKKCYSTVVPEIRGERKELDVTVVPMLDVNDHMQGVVATFAEKAVRPSVAGYETVPDGFAGIIGKSSEMRKVFQQIRDLSQYDAPVHIAGETGTGKELVARAVHNESIRRDRPFVPINCGALPEGLVESELFGHVKGSFSGAVRDKKGRFELADTGTIFLDEVAELPKNVQVKLLRFLQEGVLEKVGSEKTYTANVRIISATNKDLKKAVMAGDFRDDLYFRLNVIPISIGPLRQRKEDIPLLVAHFLKKNDYKEGAAKPVISDEALDAILNYDWPGNVRELENAIQFAMIKCRDNVIAPVDLPLELAENGGGDLNRRGPSRKLDEATVYDALVKAGGNKSKTARILGVGRATLYRFLNEHPEVVPEDA